MGGVGTVGDWRHGEEGGGIGGALGELGHERDPVGDRQWRPLARRGGEWHCGERGCLCRCLGGGCLRRCLDAVADRMEGASR